MKNASKLFTPVTSGPLRLRNRTIRSAAFESMRPAHEPSEMLLNYHRSVAAGGIGMTTVAYAAVTRGGLSFERQLWIRPEIVPGLRRLTDAVHAKGVAVAIQLGHCGIIRQFLSPSTNHRKDEYGGFLTNRMLRKEQARCYCKHSNYCIARMYSTEMACHQHLQEELPQDLKKQKRL